MDSPETNAMHATAAPNELPAVTVIDITDPTCAGEGVEMVDMDAVKLEPGGFLARRVIVRTGVASLLFHSTNRRVRTRTRSREGLNSYAFFGPGAQGSINGIPVRPGLVLAIAPEVELQVVVHESWETVTFFLPPALVRTQLAVRQRDDPFLMPQEVEILDVPVEAAQALFVWGKALVETSVAQADLFNANRDGLRVIEVDLIERLLATIAQASSHALEPGDRRLQRRSAIVECVERFALAQAGLGHNLYVGDLCKAAGVSERTLEYAFREVMGMTPVAFLIQLRLHRVRQALLAAGSGSTLVSTMALRWGFWHFGEFAQAYRRCFGELPSDTLGGQRAIK